MGRTQRLQPTELQCAANLLKEGLLVAFPTETVYGLGAPIFNPKAIQSIFEVKGRPADNPLIAHVSSLLQIGDIAEEIPESFYLLAKSFFPGPLTVVLKRRSNVPPLVSAGSQSIALRMPSHPIALQLISLVGEPLVAPSANLSGKPSATTADHVIDDFEGKIGAVIDGGKTDLGLESTVISLLREIPILLRPGAVSKEQIEQVLGCFVESNHFGPLLSPGMKYRHYSPRTPIKIFQAAQEIEHYLNTHPSASSRMLLSLSPLSFHFRGVDPFTLSAREFYSLLRLADKKDYQEILILCDNALQKQPALMNRLVRATGEYAYESDRS